jgi:dienelactone hydrolase
VLLGTACGGSPSGRDASAAPAPAPAPASAPAPAPVIVEPDGPGRLESATALNRVPAADIVEALKGPDSRIVGLTPVYDVANVRLTYLTTDGQGRQVVASGLVSLPIKATSNGQSATSPVLSYQHATIFKDAEAPSNNAVAAEPTVILASLGYVVIAADYIGFGASRGTPHPYLVAAPSASVVLDLLTAAKTWRLRNGVADNGQLFMAGYSEGGYVTVAAHRAMQAGNSEHLRALKAVVPGAGPYHVTATLDELLRRVREQNPVLGALINPGLLRYLGGSVRRQVRDALLERARADDADVEYDSVMIDHYLADDTAALDRVSNVHDWAPAAPVRFFHGRDDQTVPYVSSTRTLAAMRARAAADIGLSDCPAAPSSHIGCVPAYFAFVLAELAPLARDL